jgi:hypothetical protein
MSDTDVHDAISHIAGEGKAGGGGTTPLFLGLFLLILAFFILLVSISTVEKVKSKAVLDSLNSTFSTILPPSSSLSVFKVDEGKITAGELFQQKITNIFTSTIEVAKIEIAHPGRLMRVRIPADSLFYSGKSKIRTARFPLLDRIVTALSSPPAGVRYDMEFVIGTKYVGGQSLPIAGTLEISRAGVFARDLIARGAPADSVSVGIKPGNPAEVVIWFHVRPANETRLEFKEKDLGKATKGANKGNKAPADKKTVPPVSGGAPAPKPASNPAPNPAPAKHAH